MNYMILFLISYVFNILALYGVYRYRLYAKRDYETVRNFFARPLGYGYHFILGEAGRLRKKFTKLQSLTFNPRGSDAKKVRYADQEAYFTFDGMPSLLFNNKDMMPINIRSLDKSKDLFRHAEQTGNVFVEMKALAEAEAWEKGGKVLVLLFVVIVILLGIAVGLAYLIYQLSPALNAGAAAVIQAS